MDYKEKYETALGRARELYMSLKEHQDWVASYHAIENIFPELKESEDERIRKALLNEFIHLQSKGYKFAGLEGEEIVAWLEKQENKDSQVILSNISWHAGSEEPEEQCEILCEWESKDAVWHDVAFYHADTKTFWNGAEKIEAVVRWIYVNEILEKQAEQKPAAWSEEDEMIVLSIEQVMNCASLLNIVPDKIDKIRTWLKSLKDRVQSQPEQDWSEEDEDYLLDVLSSKERVQPQNAWKPSDEQMKVLLSEVTAWTKGCPKQIVLESLYDDLKKLREE